VPGLFPGGSASDILRVVKFVVKVDELGDDPSFPMADEELVYARREDARLSAERYAGKAMCSFLVIEYDDAGNEVRVETYDPEQGGYQTWGASGRNGRPAAGLLAARLRRPAIPSVRDHRVTT
jgi:hypothetical protein